MRRGVSWGMAWVPRGDWQESRTGFSTLFSLSLRAERDYGPYGDVPTMGYITISNLDDEVLRALEQRAAVHGRSLEAEAQAVLTEALGLDRRAIVDRLRRRLDSYGDREFSDSAELIRELRDERAEYLANRK